MGANIAGFVICLLCATPFFIIGHYKNSNYPIGLSTKDGKLSTKIHDVKQFNEEMSKLYLRCALVFGITGLITFAHVMTGIILIMLESTVGVFIVSKKHKAIVSKFVEPEVIKRSKL